MKGWHVTSRRNRESICQGGLLTKAPVIFPSGKVEEGRDAGFVWFFLDRDRAEESAATGAWGGTQGENDIWEIDLTDFDVIDDPHPGWGEDRSNRAVAHSISADRVRLAS